MKRLYILILAALLLAGCAGVPKPDPVQLSGTIDFDMDFPEAPELDNIKGMFKVDGDANLFQLYLYDESGMPIGNVTVEEGVIYVSGLGEKKRKIYEVFHYWPYIFGWGSRKKAGEVNLAYSDWIETEEGRFPGITEISAPRIFARLYIKYGEKISGQD